MPARKRKIDGGAPAPAMELIFLVYSNAVDEEIVEILRKRSGGYTKFTGVLGEGNGEPHLGSHIWPELNNCAMAAVTSPVRDIIAEDIAGLKTRFPGAGINIFVTPLKEMI